MVVKIVPIAEGDRGQGQGGAVWGAVYKISAAGLEALTSKGSKHKCEMVELPVQLFQRDKSIGRFGNEIEAQLLAGEVASVHALVREAEEGEMNGARLLDEENKLVVRINRAIVEVCPEGLCAAYVEDVLRKWVPRPRTPDGIYW